MKLIIGYGNELRGDDSVGPRAARVIAAWNLPRVRVLAVHQLTPELAAVIADADEVLFIDASITATEAMLTTVAPAEDTHCLGHTGNPAALLSLSAAVTAHRPHAELLTIPARSFEFGAELSLTTEQALHDALGIIRSWVEQRRTVSSCV